jgi:hypothetical protein
MDHAISKKKGSIRVIVACWFGCMVILFAAVSCRLPHAGDSPCRRPYLISQLFKDYGPIANDVRLRDSIITVYDSLSPDKARGYYQFDKNNNLRFYCFLCDKASNYYFGITYDSLGNELGKTGGDVVRWSVGKKGDDSLIVSCLFYKINRSYGSLYVTGSDFSKNLALYEARYYSNMIAAEFTIDRHQKGIVLLKGRIRDDCSGKERDIMDSLRVPDDL